MTKDTRPYIAVTDELYEHPKFRRLKNPWARLHIMGLWMYANKYRTDGVVDADKLMEIGEDVGEELLKHGWLDGPDVNGDYHLHDYLKHQKSKAEIEGLQSKRKEAASWGNHRRWHVKLKVVEATCGYCTGETAPPANAKG